MLDNRQLNVAEPVRIEEVNSVIEKQIKENKLLVYMKGSSVFPQCGFSARVIEILNMLNADYKTFDVLSDPVIREGIKRFSNWPTIPQVYFNNEFIGGCDILTEMYQKGELQELIGQG